ncbi:MAG: hypothetical protein R3A79_05465 [Nannocystaceae bacterium]
MRRARDLVVTILLFAPLVVASACGPKSPGEDEPAVVSVAPGGGAALPEPEPPAPESKAAPAQLRRGESAAGTSIYSTRTAPAYADEKAAPAQIETVAPASEVKLAAATRPRDDGDGEGEARGDGKSASPADYDGKAAPRDDEARPEDRPKGAHAVPVARRDDLGKPGQGTPLGAVAAFVAAVDDGDREAATALMTDGCLERERSWDKSFSKAIFDRGLRFHIIKLRDASSAEDDRASVRLGVVFLDSAGEPDNEGMSFTLVKRDDAWWIDEIR